MTAYLNAAQVAGELGHAATWFYRHRARLERDLGFPKPVLDGNRWDAGEIETWKQRRWSIEPPAEIEGAAAPSDADIDDLLDRRAADIAEGLEA